MQSASLSTAAVLGVLATLIAACSAPTHTALPGVTDPGPTAPPNVAATPATPPPAALDSPPPTDGPATLVPDTIAQVVTTDLVVRSLPEISDASVILEPYLDEPTLLFIVGGPVASSGYEWFQVQPFGMHYLDFMAQPPPFGWVAAGSRDGEAWIAPASLDCPEPTLEEVRAMSDTARLACYGATELVLDGEFAGCFVADPTIGTPEWLFQTGCGLVPDGYEAGAVTPDPGSLSLRFARDPGLPHDNPGAPIRVTGHLDDQAARSCRSVSVSDEGGAVAEPMTTEAAILYCRTQFILTAVEIRGR